MIENNETQEEIRNLQSSTLTWLIEWGQVIVTAVVIALIIRTFLFTIVSVDGRSMEPTLHNKDKMIAWRLAYKPQVHDIVIFKPFLDKKDYYVKRVIGLPGDTIDFDHATGNVIVNGVIQNESYTKEKNINFGNTQWPKTVPEGKVFVMGDNRNNSHDSRMVDIGFVDYKQILGKAVFRFWPLSGVGVMNR